MSDRPDLKPKRIFKRFKLNELSLVDEACIHGSDILVIKARSTAGRESDSDLGNEQDRGSGHPDAEVYKAARKHLEPFGALNDALAADEITLKQFVERAGQMVTALEPETQAGEPVNKSAAGLAASIISETVMTLEQLQAALATAETAIDTVKARNVELEGEVTVQKARADKAEATVVTLTEDVAKAKKEGGGEAEQTEEEVLKALPPALRKIVTDAKAMTVTVEKQRDDAMLETAVAKAKRAGVADPDKVGEALVAVRKSNAAHADVIEAALAASAAQAAEGDVFKSLGIAVDSDTAKALEGGDPEAVLKAKGEEIRKAKPGLTVEEAYSEAIEANPAIYNAFVAKRRQTGGQAAH